LRSFIDGSTPLLIGPDLSDLTQITPKKAAEFSVKTVVISAAAFERSHPVKVLVQQWSDAYPNLATTDSPTADQEVSSTELSEETRNEDDPVLEELWTQTEALSDEATDIDLLDYRHYSRAIFEFVAAAKSKPPMSIGISAPWGIGKSSLMKQVKGRLDLHRKGGRDQDTVPCFTVEVNAWKYGSDEAIWPAITSEIYEQTASTLSPWERFKFRTVLALSLPSRSLWSALGAWNVWVALIILAVSAVIAIVFADTSELKLLDISAWEPDNTVRGFAPSMPLVVAVITTFVNITGWTGFRRTFQSPFSRRLKRSIDAGISGAARAPKEAEDDINRMLDFLTHDGEARVVVFIDDLDRCTPGRVLETVEALNLLFTNSGRSRNTSREIVFILGMDRELVAASLSVAYRDLVSELRDRGSVANAGGFGHRFLSKIVQMSFVIPPPQREAMERFINHHVALDRPIGESDLPDPNPSDELVDNYVRRLRPILRNPEDVSDRVEALRQELLAEIAADTSEGTGQMAQMRTDAVTASLVDVESTLVSRLMFADAPDIQREIAHAAVNYLGRNPRDVKRFINSVRLQLLVFYYMRSEWNQGQIRQIAKWGAIQLRWPGFAEESLKRPTTLKDTEELLSESGPDATFSETDLKERGFPNRTTQLILHDLDFRRVMRSDPELAGFDFEKLPLVS
jgi:hypothetical protein